MTDTPNKPRLAVAMIVKNEAKNLQKCLDAIHTIADEIVIVDAGSTDTTAEVAQKYTEKFYVHDQWPGFGPQRRIAQSYVSAEYILWLDADEVVTEKVKQQIVAAVAKNEAKTLYSFCRLNYFFARYIRHGGWYPDHVVRLYPSHLTQYTDALVHEKIEIPDDCEVVKLAGDVIHYSYRDLRHYLTKSAHYAQAWAEQKQKRGKKASLSQASLHAFGCFVRMYILRGGFMDGKQGLLIALLSAHSTFVKYADLWIRGLRETDQ